MKKELLTVTILTLISLSSYSQTIFNAIKDNDIPAVKHLCCNKSVNINQKVAGFTPLMFAMSLNNDRAVKLLLQADADVEVTDQNGNTPLMLACQNRNEEQVATMLNHYPDLDRKNAAGKTALMLAAISGNRMNVKQLLNFGAKANVKDKQGKTALDYAMQYNHARVIWVLNDSSRVSAHANTAE